MTRSLARPHSEKRSFGSWTRGECRAWGKGDVHTCPRSNALLIRKDPPNFGGVVLVLLPRSNQHVRLFDITSATTAELVLISLLLSARFRSGNAKVLGLTTCVLHWESKSHDEQQLKTFLFHRDLKLSTPQYQSALWAYYLTYIISEVPSNLGKAANPVMRGRARFALLLTSRVPAVIKKVSPKIWLPCLTAAWGLVAAMLGVCQSYGSFVAVRAVLGAVEGGLLPGMVSAHHLSFRNFGQLS